MARGPMYGADVTGATENGAELRSVEDDVKEFCERDGRRGVHLPPYPTFRTLTTFLVRPLCEGAFFWFRDAIASRGINKRIASEHL